MSNDNKKTKLDSFVESNAPICYGILKPGEHYPNGIPVIKVKNIAEGNILENDLLKTSPEIHEQYKRSEVRFGDILLTIRGTTGRVAIVPASLNGANITQDTARIRVSSDDDSLYVFYALQSPKVKQEIALNTIGQAVKGINIAEVRKLEIFHPPVIEQKKIAQILSTWDKAITVTEKLLTNSQQKKKALMQQLLTGKKRLLDEGGVRFSRQWEKGKLCDIANIDSGYAFKSNDFTQSDSGIPIIRMSDFKTGGLDVSGAAKVDKDSVNGLDKFKLKAGDFVFGMSGSLNNYGRVEKKDLPCYLNQRVGRILAKECASQAFITYVYLSDPIQQSVLDKAAGAAQLNISISDLRSMVVYYPCIEEQQKIASVLSAADAEISILKKKLTCLKDEKKALMQQLLTGKRRVKVDAEEAVSA